MDHKWGMIELNDVSGSLILYMDCTGPGRS